MNRVLATVAMAATMATSTLAMAETTLIFSEAGPNRGARAAALQSFVDDMSARTDGEVKIDVQWGGALFKANAAAQAIGDGVADLGTIIAVYFPQEMLGYGIADLPLRNADAWVGMRATDELMRNSDAMQQSLADQNLVYIATFTASAVHIACKDTTIRTVEDIKGLKVRGVGAYGETFRDFGANMVPMSIYKAYQGLDTGLLDCSQGYSYAVAALKQQEVMTSYTMLNWGQIGAIGIFMNKDVYDGLSDDVKAGMADAGVGMADKLGELLTTGNDKAVEVMKEAGVEVVELPSAERDKLVEKGAPYVEKWVKQSKSAGLDGAALLEEYEALLAKYAEERDSKGYPWARK